MNIQLSVIVLISSFQNETNQENQSYEGLLFFSSPFCFCYDWHRCLSTILKDKIIKKKKSKGFTKEILLQSSIFIKKKLYKQTLLILRRHWKKISIESHNRTIYYNVQMYLVTKYQNGLKHHLLSELISFLSSCLCSKWLWIYYFFNGDTFFFSLFEISRNFDF